MTTVPTRLKALSANSGPSVKHFPPTAEEDGRTFVTSVKEAPDTAPALDDDAPVCEGCGARLITRGTRGRKLRYCTKACSQRARRAKIEAEEATRSAAALSVPGEAQGTSDPLTVCHGEGRLPGAETGGRTGPEVDHALSGMSESDLDQSQDVGKSISDDGAFPQVSELSFTDSPWYYAKFAAPGTEKAGKDRRLGTRKLRALLRTVTNVERCQRCGRDITGSVVALVVREDVAHIAGVETCGRIWLCPVCSAKIRAHRGDEIAEAVGRHVIARDGDAYFLTATLPHDQGDALTASLGTLAAAWRWMTSHKLYKAMTKRLDLVGYVKAVEITHGGTAGTRTFTR